MNARTELAPEGWGLGDVMLPAARGWGRGLQPPVTSWGFGAGPARPPGRWGAGSPEGAAGRSLAPTEERGARGSRPAPLPARALGFVRSWAGRTRGGQLGGVCARAEISGSLGSLTAAGAGAGAARAESARPQFPSSRTRKLGRPLRALLNSRKRARLWKRSFFSGNSGGGSPGRLASPRPAISSLSLCKFRALFQVGVGPTVGQRHLQPSRERMITGLGATLRC